MREILLTPGPTPVPEEVLRVMAEPIYHHRTPRYRKLFSSVSERLKNIFLTKNTVYTITGSGTAAMEASMVNFHSAGDEILVVDSGKFGERFTEISKAYGIRADVLKVPYGEAVRPEAVAEKIKANPKLRSVCVELCETSTAVLQDIQAIGRVTQATDTLLIVDAISALGADRLETDKWNVDLVVAASQKALMLPPGLAFISVSDKARRHMEKGNIPRYYLDLRLFEKALKDADTPFTPAISLVVGLDKVLSRMEAEGMENIFKRCWDLGEWTRQRLKHMGLTLFSKSPAATCSAACVPAGIDGEKLVKIMRDEKGVTLAGGQGEMKGKIARIAHMGAITKEDLETGLRVLQETLQELGAAVKV